MDDRLIKDETSSPRVLGEPAPAKQHSLARMQAVPWAVPWLVVVLLLAAVAWLAWEAFGREEEGDVVASAMLAFEKQNSLNVFSSRFEVVAQSVSTPSIGPFEVEALQSRQAMIVPALVEYRLDLSQMTREDFDWSPETQTLEVTVPGLRISRPNIDEANARLFTDGVFVSRDAATSLSQSNSEIAERRAIEFARNPEVLALARSAARTAIRQNLAIPLEAVGFGDVTVSVRFEGEHPGD